MDDIGGPPLAPRLPLSLPQRVWYRPHDPGVIAVEFLRTPNTLALSGPLDAALLARALGKIRERHPILRTRYGFDGTEAFQAEADEEPPTMKVVDLSTLPDEMHERAVWTVLKEAYDRPPAYEAGQPMWIWLFKVNPERHLFAAIIDHIALDNRSMYLILKDAFTYYHGLVNETEPNLVADPPAYGDYVLASRERQGSERTTENLAWWRERLDGVEPVNLRDAKLAPYPAVSRRVFLPLRFKPQSREAAFAFARENRLSISMMLSGLFGLMLGRWADTDQVLAAYVVDDRTPRMADTAGSFVRSAPYHLDLSGDPTARDLFARSRRAYLDALNPDRAINSNDIPGLANAIINLQTPRPESLPPKDAAEAEERRRNAPRPGGLTITGWSPQRRLQETMSLDLQIYLRVHADHIGGHVLCAAERLNSERAIWFALSAPMVLDRLITQPDEPISVLAPRLAEAVR